MTRRTILEKNRDVRCRTAEASGARNADNQTPTHAQQRLSPILTHSGEAVFEANRACAQTSRGFGLPVPPLPIHFVFRQRSFLFLHRLPVAHTLEKDTSSRRAFQRFVQIAAECRCCEYGTASARQELIAQARQRTRRARSIPDSQVPLLCFRPAFRTEAGCPLIL